MLELDGVTVGVGRVSALEGVGARFGLGLTSVLSPPNEPNSPHLLGYVLAGKIKPRRGGVLLDGKRVRPGELRKRVALVSAGGFRGGGQVDAAIARALRAGGAVREELAVAVPGAAELAGLQASLKPPAKNLSLEQRVGLALLDAALRRPKAIVVDRAFQGVSPAGATRLAGVLRAIAAAFPTVVVLTQPSAAEALAAGGGGLTLARGQIVESGGIFDLHGRPARLETVYAFSAPPPNLIDVTVEGGVRRLPDGSTLELPGIADGLADGVYTLAFRPRDAKPERTQAGDVRFVVRSVGGRDVAGEAMAEGVFAGAKWLAPAGSRGAPPPGLIFNIFVSASRISLFADGGHAARRAGPPEPEARAEAASGGLAQADNLMAAANA